MKKLMWPIGLVMLLLFAFLIMLSMTNDAEAGGPWSNQYCNLKTEHTVIKDKEGNVISESVVETQVCDDSAKDFLHGMGIASNCQLFTWDMPYQNTLIKERSIVCQRLDGTYEIVPGYHSVE